MTRCDQRQRVQQSGQLHRLIGCRVNPGGWVWSVLIVWFGIDSERKFVCEGRCFTQCRILQFMQVVDERILGYGMSCVQLAVMLMFSTIVRKERVWLGGIDFTSVNNRDLQQCIQTRGTAMINRTREKDGS